MAAAIPGGSMAPSVVLLPARVSVEGGGSTETAMHGKPARRRPRIHSQSFSVLESDVDINVRSARASLCVASAVSRCAPFERLF